MAYKLVYQLRGRLHEHRLDGTRVTIGRDPENALVVPDVSVSRRHASLEWNGDHWRIIDTQSRNGVRLNGLPIDPGDRGARALTDGDGLVLGSVVARFVREEADKLVLDEGRPEDDTDTNYRPVTDFKELIRTSGAQSTLPVEAQEVLGRARRILDIVVSLGQRITAVRPFEEIIESIIDLVFEATPAERAALLLWDDTVAELVPKVVRHRQGPVAGEFRVSRTIVSKAFDQRCTVQLDPKATGGSILRLGLRSAVAVPLWDQERVVGVAYADSSLQAGIFDAFSISLLSALANYAAIAIEQSRLLLRLQQEERARERLGRYHSPAVVRRILSSGDSSSSFTVAAQEAQVTVLFADMVNFTGAADELSPQEVMIMLNQYFSQLTEVIFDYEGTLDKYVGDCIMAAFGAPLPQADHARRAALTALNMREVVRGMNEKRVQRPMDFRIGLNSGTVVAGDVGSAKRKEWTVLGSTVNLASRMESTARAGQIVMTQSTRALLGDEFEVRSLGAMRPKGFPRDVEVFELVGLKS